MPRTRKNQEGPGAGRGGGAGKPRGAPPGKPPGRKAGPQAPPAPTPAPDLTGPAEAARAQLEQLRRECEGLAARLTDLKVVSGDLGRQLSLPTRQDLQELTARSETIGAGLREATRELELLYGQALASQQRLSEEGRAASEGMARDLAAQYQALRRAFAETAGDLQAVRRQAVAALQESLQFLNGQARALAQTFAEADLILRAGAGERIRESTDQIAREVGQLLLPAREELSAVRSLLAALPAELERSRREARRLRRQLRAARQEARRLARGQEGRGEEEAPAGGAPAEGNWLGVTVDPGVVVADVLPGTPAAKAGLVRGDVILRVNGQPVYSATELRDLIQGTAPGTELAVSVARRATQEEVKARMEPPPPGPGEGDRLGVTADPGVVVAEVAPGSPGALAGLAPGDIIAGVNGTPVLGPTELRDLLAGAPPGDVTLQLVRRGSPAEVIVPMGEPGAQQPPAPEGQDRLGVTVSPGVVVAEVRPGTPAERAGLLSGDVITAVDGEPVHTAVGLRDAVRKHDPGDEVTLTLTRGDESREVRARLDEVDLPELGTPS